MYATLAFWFCPRGDLLVAVVVSGRVVGIVVEEGKRYLLFVIPPLPLFLPFLIYF